MADVRGEGETPTISSIRRLLPVARDYPIASNPRFPIFFQSRFTVIVRLHRFTVRACVYFPISDRLHRSTPAFYGSPRNANIKQLVTDGEHLFTVHSSSSYASTIIEKIPLRHRNALSPQCVG